MAAADSSQKHSLSRTKPQPFFSHIADTTDTNWYLVEVSRWTKYRVATRLDDALARLGKLHRISHC
jgi:hypothetical protein